VQALSNSDITVYGDGTQTRSFCYVDDMVEGLVKLFFSVGVHMPVNLGNPVPIRTNSLAQEIIELTNSKSKIIYKPIPSDDPKLREPDISLARRILDWEPVVERRVGLLKTIEYFKN
jgi:nucleoside-diphosphate-sugar epimerase